MQKPSFRGLSSSSLHLLAMALMVGDHLWATLFPAQEWLTCLGRLSFPIFAFLIAEGARRTSNIRRYTGRIFLFALLSEVPFNLLYGSSVIYPFHQNVLWSFFIALLAIRILEWIKQRNRWWLTAAVFLAVAWAAWLLGTLAMVDYFGPGVLMVLTFYVFRGDTLWSKLCQVVLLAVLNIRMLGGYYYSIPFFGRELQVVRQGFALFALIPIWLYHGQKGCRSKLFQYGCYCFYPVHLLLLYLIWQLSI